MTIIAFNFSTTSVSNQPKEPSQGDAGLQALFHNVLLDPFPILSLPDEIILEICLKLSSKDLLRLSKTCRKLHQIARPILIKHKKAFIGVPPDWIANALPHEVNGYDF